MADVRLNDPVAYTMQQFEASGFTYGSIIPKQWFDLRFGLTEPETIADAHKNQTLYATMMGQLRARLLVEKNMALRTKQCVGQEVVQPAEQTEWAMAEAQSNIAKELEKARDRLLHVNFGELTAEERRENSDAVAKLSFFQKKSLKALK